MSKSNNFLVIFLVTVATIIVGSVIITQNAQTPDVSVGGNFNPVVVDFAQGISVGGTQVISSSRGITATGATSIGSTSNGLNYYAGKLTPTTDTTLTAAQTGSVVNMGTAGLDVTLPPVATSNGVHFKFLVSAAFATTSMTVVSAEGDNIEGSVVVAGAIVDCAANDVLTFVNDGEDIGDFVELYSNGTNWLIGGSNALTAAKLTCTG